MQVQGSARAPGLLSRLFVPGPTSSYLRFHHFPQRSRKLPIPTGLVGERSLPFKGTRQSLASASRPHNLVRDSVMAQDGQRAFRDVLALHSQHANIPAIGRPPQQ
jgi:hypothetical protein